MLGYEQFAEPGFEECFDCPFEDCTERRARSAACPRRRAVMEGAGRDIPEGWITRDEVAERVGHVVSWVDVRIRAGMLESIVIPLRLNGGQARLWRLVSEQSLERLLEVVCADG